MSWKLRLAAIFVTAAGCAITPGIARAGVPEGCTAAVVTSCSYVATRTGGIAGNGYWQARIVRGAQEILVDGGVLPFKQANVIHPGDRVALQAFGSICPCCPWLFSAVTAGPSIQ